MNGLDNNINANEEGFIDKMKKKWDELPGVVKFVIIFAAVVLIVLLIVYWLRHHHKKSDNDVPSTENTTDSGGTKEGFLTGASDLTVNDYVNSYIASTRGTLVSNA